MFIIFLSLLFDLIIMTFFANIFTKLRLVQLKFTEIFKILVYCSTFPTILSAALQFIWPQVAIGSFGLAFTLIFSQDLIEKLKNKKEVMTKYSVITSFFEYTIF
jgi:maltodextrin utilization protein YvdJ